MPYDVVETGTHLEPAQFHELLSQAKDADDLVVLDVRNRFEYAIGRFRDAVGREAVHPCMRNFTQFRDFIDREGQQQLKGKRVAMYCTGGIRCESASAYLRSKGLAKEVYQLHGGIHKYCEAFPGENSLFKGQNFVFDRRIALPSGSTVGLASAVSVHVLDEFVPGVVCSVCVCLVLVCQKCRGGVASDAYSVPRREWFCEEHAAARSLFSLPRCVLPGRPGATARLSRICS